MGTLRLPNVPPGVLRETWTIELAVIAVVFTVILPGVPLNAAETPAENAPTVDVTFTLFTIALPLASRNINVEAVAADVAAATVATTL